MRSLLDCNKKGYEVMTEGSSQALDEKSSLVQSANNGESGGNGPPRKHSDRGLYIIVGITATATAALTVAMIFQALFGEPQVKPHAAVATAFPECSRISLEAMKKGGCAVDAAVSAALCLTIVAPYAAGFGGGGVMMVHRQSQQMTTEVIDFLETAPELLPSVEQDSPSISKVGVPGFLRGLSESHKKYGKLSWKDILSPIIVLARSGFTMSQPLHDAILKSGLSADLPISSQYFEDGKLIEVGKPIVADKMGDLLTSLLTDGIDALYSGERSLNFLKNLTSLGSTISADDMKAYKVETRRPIGIATKGRKVLIPPSPTTGPVLALGLKVLGNLDGIGTLTVKKLSSTIQLLFRLDEKISLITDLNVTTNHSASDQPIYNDESMQKVLDNLPHFIKRPDNASAEDPPVESVQGVFVDDNDLFASFTLSLGDAFGSKLMTPDGIILNNALKRFTDEPSDEVNALLPYARPRTNVFPIMVIPDEGLCGERFADSSRHWSTYLEVIANAAGSDLTLGQAASSNLVWVDTASKAVRLQAKEDDTKQLLDNLRLLGYDLETVAQKNIIDIVGKFGDDITNVLSEPSSAPESAIQF